MEEHGYYRLKPGRRDKMVQCIEDCVQDFLVSLKWSMGGDKDARRNGDVEI